MTQSSSSAVSIHRKPQRTRDFGQRKAADDLIGTEHGYWRFTEVRRLLVRDRVAWCLIAVCVCGNTKVCEVWDCRGSISCGCRAAEGHDSEGAQEIREHRAENPQYYLYELARKRVDVRNGEVPFSITARDVKVPARCPILKIRMDGKDVRPVLTQLDPSLGYVPSNVLVISEQAHLLRSNDCVKYLRWVRKSGLAAEFRRAKDALYLGPFPRKVRGSEAPELRRPVIQPGDLFRSRETGEVCTVKKSGVVRVTFKDGTSVPVWKLRDGYDPTKETPKPAPAVPEAPKLDLAKAEKRVRFMLEDRPWIQGVEGTPRGWTKSDRARWTRHVKQVSDTIKAFLNGRIPFDDLPYDTLGVFSVRMIHVLEALKVETVPDLLRVSTSDFHGVGNCGRKTISGIKKLLGEYGLTLLDTGVVLPPASGEPRPSGAP